MYSVILWAADILVIPMFRIGIPNNDVSEYSLVDVDTNSVFNLLVFC